MVVVGGGGGAHIVVVVAPLLHYPCPCLSVACVWGVLDSVGGDILLRGPGSGIAAQYLPSPSVDSVLRQPGCLLHNNPRTVTSVPYQLQ